MRAYFTTGYHDINLRKVTRGWVVTVGCKTIVYLDKQHANEESERLITDFAEYIRDPHSKQTAFEQLYSYPQEEVANAATAPSPMPYPDPGIEQSAGDGSSR